MLGLEVGLKQIIRLGINSTSVCGQQAKWVYLAIWNIFSILCLFLH